MTTHDPLIDELNQLYKRRDEFARRIAELEALQQARHDAFETARQEAQIIARQMDEWKALNPTTPNPDAPLSALFLGALSGEWAAQSRYRGTLPGFGGFVIVADGKYLLIDPGRSTLANLYAADIHPRILDYVIVTHSHWDCVRDLPLVVMAASETHISSVRSGPPKLRLLAPKSVLEGHQMDVDAVVEDDLFPARHNCEATRQRLRQFPTMNPPALGAFDLFVRLGEQFDTLEIDKQYEISPAVELWTRFSYHRDTFGVEAIAGLDFLVRRTAHRSARCVYLSDTEYRPDLADAYAAEGLGPIDLLICNVKTLDVRPQEDGPYKGYTQRHLGWKGLLQLTRDFQQRNLLTPTSLVVLRAWGIETVTQLDPTDGVMTAKPEKLRIYEERYVSETQQPAVVPGQTWVSVADNGTIVPRVRHVRPPFRAEGAARHFGSVWYCSERFAEIVRMVQPVAENPDELLLITGDTGVGKDGLAHAIHQESGRRGELVVVGLGVLQSDLAWAHLVGHSKDAFTGALADRDGSLTDAAGGTLAFEEFADLRPEHQALLLTLLSERKYERLGDHREYLLTAQVIATTSYDILELVNQGRFRAALYHRFQRRVCIPPLRERREDIRAIAYGWHVEQPDRYPALDPDAIALLQRYDWPGNVRGLQNVFIRLSHGGDWSLERIREEAEAEHACSRAASTTAPNAALEPDEERVLQLLAGGRSLARREIEQAIAPQSKGATVRCLNRLERKGLVRREGRGPTTRYKRVA